MLEASRGAKLSGVALGQWQKQMRHTETAPDLDTRKGPTLQPHEANFLLKLTKLTNRNK